MLGVPQVKQVHLMKIQSVFTVPIIVGAGAAILLPVTGVQLPLILSTGALTPFPVWNYLLVSLTLIGLGWIFSHLRYPGTSEKVYKFLTSAIRSFRDESELWPSIPVLIGLFAIGLIVLLSLYALAVFLFGLFLSPVQTALTIAILTATSSAIFQRNNKVEKTLEEFSASLNQGHQNSLFTTVLDIVNFGLAVTQAYLWNSVYLTHGIVAMVALLLTPMAISYVPLVVTALNRESEG